MVIDSEEHRTLLLELIKAASFPGHLLDLACEVKQAVQHAEIPAE